VHPPLRSRLAIRRDNPYDNAEAGSFTKTMKVEAVAWSPVCSDNFTILIPVMA
jgi:hypothetical protein